MLNKVDACVQVQYWSEIYYLAIETFMCTGTNSEYFHDKLFSVQGDWEMCSKVANLYKVWTRNNHMAKLDRNLFEIEKDILHL